MNEQQLAELFREAAGGGPPARFALDDVISSSRRATARRRRAIAGGSAVAVLALVGSIVFSGGLRGTDSGAEQAATAGSVNQPQSGDLVAGEPRGQQPGPQATPPPPAVDQNVPEAKAEQGRPASGKVVPWPGLRDGIARAGCGPVDRELADALIGELSATPDAPLAPVPDACPPAARAAALQVPGGMIYVVLAPSGDGRTAATGGGRADQPVRRDDGAAGYAVYTPTSRMLLVLGVPATPGGAVPLAERIRPAAEKIARSF